MELTGGQLKELPRPRSLTDRHPSGTTKIDDAGTTWRYTITSMDTYAIREIIPSEEIEKATLIIGGQIIASTTKTVSTEYGENIEFWRGFLLIPSHFFFHNLVVEIKYKEEFKESAPELTLPMNFKDFPKYRINLKLEVEGTPYNNTVCVTEGFFGLVYSH